MKIRLEVCYDGTSFEGWQRQPHTSNTLQGALELALSRLLEENLVVVASGRTDAGVHAQSQHLHFSTSRDLTRYNLVKAVNSKLPQGLAVLAAWEAPEEFHAQHSAIGKTYQYRIHTGPSPHPLLERYSHWVPQPLDVGGLNELSQPLLGSRDFKSFQTTGTTVKSTVRDIFMARWEARGEGEYLFTLKGSGFLKQMVRNIVGTQLDVLRSGDGAEKIEEILAARDRRSAGGTAPPQGLSLLHVEYPTPLDKKCRKI